MANPLHLIMLFVLGFLGLSASCVSSFPQPTSVRGISYSTTPRYAALVQPTSTTWAAVARTIHDINSSTPIPKRLRALPYDTSDTTDDATDVTETTDAGEDLETSTGVDSIEDLSSSTSPPTTTSTPFIPEFFTTFTPVSTSVSSETSTVSSDVSPSSSSGSILGAATQLKDLHPVVIPILVGAGVGTLALIGMTVLLICCRRRKHDSINSTSKRWFNSDEKGVIVSIRVPPPTVPLKGILIQNPTAFPSSPTGHDPHPDRVSLTSSQLSVIINNLPKTYDSGLESGVLDEVRAEGRRSSIQATRIGPSPSDFFANLFAGSHSITSSSLGTAASQAMSSPPQSPRRSVVLIPRNDEVPVKHDAFVYPYTPTFQHSPAASPNLGFANGPRGHGLVLTGDLNAMVPSFAQWHYQRTVARSRDENGVF